MNKQNNDVKFDKVVFGGYDPEQVDSFIDEAKEKLVELKKENLILIQKLNILADKIEEYRSKETEEASCDTEEASVVNAEPKKTVEEVAEESAPVDEIQTALPWNISENDAYSEDCVKAKEEYSAACAELEDVRAKLEDAKAELEAVKAEKQHFYEVLIDAYSAELARLKEESGVSAESPEAVPVCDGATDEPEEEQPTAEIADIADDKAEADSEVVDAVEAVDVAEDVDVEQKENDAPVFEKVIDEPEETEKVDDISDDTAITVDEIAAAIMSENDEEEVASELEAPKNEAVQQEEPHRDLTYDEYMSMILNKVKATAVEEEPAATEKPEDEPKQEQRSDEPETVQKKPEKKRQSLLQMIKEAVLTVINDDGDDDEDDLPSFMNEDCDNQPTLKFGKDYDVKSDK